MALLTNKSPSLLKCLLSCKVSSHQIIFGLIKSCFCQRHGKGGLLFGGAEPQLVQNHWGLSSAFGLVVPKVYCWPHREFVAIGVDMRDEWHSTISSPTSSTLWCGLLRAGPIDIGSHIVLREDSMGWISSTTLSIGGWKPKHPSCFISASMGKC